MIFFWTNHARLLSFPRIEASNTVKLNTPTTWLSNILWNIIEWTYLVGGFNQSEKYESKWVHLPQIEVKIKNLWNHHPVIMHTGNTMLHHVASHKSLTIRVSPLHLSRGGIRPLKQLEHPCSQGVPHLFWTRFEPPRESNKWYHFFKSKPRNGWTAMSFGK